MLYEEYQDISSEVSLLEQFAIPVLIRYNETDHVQGRLIATFAGESDTRKNFYRLLPQRVINIIGPSLS